MFELIVLFVLIFSLRHRLMNLLIKLNCILLGNYNDSYPLYSKLEISSIKANSIILSNEWSRLVDRYTKKIDRKVEKNNNSKRSEDDFEINRLFKEAWEKYYLSKELTRRLDFMIEANNLIRLNKKTINQIREEFRSKYSDYKHIQEAETAYKNWNSKKKF